MTNEYNESKNLLTIGKASEYLGVSIDTLRRWEKKGRIVPYRSPGGHRHYDKKDLDRLFNKRYTRDEPTIRRSKIKAEEPNPLDVNVDLQQNDLEPLPKITLPAWRAIKEEPIPEIPVYKEKPRVLERPLREIKIPENTRIKVTSERAFVSPGEAFYQQQSVSVLTPPANNNKPSATPTTKDSSKTPQSRQPKAPENKMLLIYLSVMASVVLFAIAWYFLWKNSQAILSPIP